MGTIIESLKHLTYKKERAEDAISAEANIGSDEGDARLMFGMDLEQSLGKQVVINQTPAVAERSADAIYVELGDNKIRFVGEDTLRVLAKAGFDFPSQSDYLKTEIA